MIYAFILNICKFQRKNTPGSGSLPGVPGYLEIVAGTQTGLKVVIAEGQTGLVVEGCHLLQGSEADNLSYRGFIGILHCKNSFRLDYSARVAATTTFSETISAVMVYSPSSLRPLMEQVNILLSQFSA